MGQIYLVGLDWRRLSCGLRYTVTRLPTLLSRGLKKQLSVETWSGCLVIVVFRTVCASVKQEIRTNSRFMKLANLGPVQTKENENGKEFNLTKLPTRGKLLEPALLDFTILMKIKTSNDDDCLL